MKPTTSAHDGTARPAERLAVMISSTSLDLPHHRETVNEAIRRVGYFPLAMEHGSAEADSNALTYSLRMVDQADLFIGILAFRYGYVPDDPVANPNGWSVTEHEYRRALQRGIPILIFLMDAAHPDARKDAELSEPAQRKLEALKAKLKTKHICGFFCSVDQLQARVIQSLSEIKISLLQRHGQHGSSRPFQSPPVPAHYIRRPKEEMRLEDDLLRQDEGPGVVVSAVFGLGGIGKSTLAAALVQSQRVQERFADGLLWVTLGQNPELLSLLGQWIRDLGDHEFRAMDVRSASGRLRQLLQERAVLLVVDDAWQSEHVEPFQVGGPRCRLLVTTRKPRIADDLHAISHELDVLSPEQAIELLATRLQRPLREDERGPALRLTEAVGRLPLALELAAVRLGRGVAWEDLLLKLEQEVAALEALEDPAERWKKKVKTQLEASLQLSLRALRAEAEEAFRCFIWLGVLPDDTTLAAPMASALWDLADADEADGLLEFLWGEALLQPAVPVRVGGKQWRAYRVHDLLHDCARRLLEAVQTPKRQEELPGLGLTRPKAHRQLLGRYRKRTRDGLWHTLGADGYIHGQLSWHLEKAGDAEGLHALLREETAEGRNGWYEANERLGQPAHFANCVAHAWRLADLAFAEGRPTLGLQCRYALLSASLNSLASNLSPELMEALVHQGVWPVEQALAYARRTPDARQKVKALARLVVLVLPRERAGVLSEALDAARSIGNEADRSRALTALAPHLPAALLSKALDTARSIRYEVDRSFVLAALASHLPAALLSEALDAARSIGDAGVRSSALTALVSHLPERERAAVLSEALDAARSIKYLGVHFRALAALAPHLPEEERAAVLSEALADARSIGDETPLYDAARSIGDETPLYDAARSIGDESPLYSALAALASHLPAALLSEALDAARSIGNEWDRSSALAALIPHLPEEERAAVLSEALDAARSSGDERACSLALAALAPHLPAALLSEALDAACSTGNEADRSRALAALIPHLPAALLSEAFDAARSVGDPGVRSRALAALAPHLPEEERAAVLSEALDAARSIGNEADRSRALAALAPHLPAALLSKALDAVRSIGYEWARSRALAALAPHLPAALLSEALDAARSIGIGVYRSRGLAALGPHLPAALLSEALDTARSIWNEAARSRALAALAPHLPERERAAVLSEALDAARSSGNEADRSRALAALTPHLPAALLSEALDAARSIEHEATRSSALAALAPHLHLPAALLSEALVAARSIGDKGARSSALAALAPRLAALPLRDLSTMWTPTLLFLAARTRQHLLADFRSLVPLLDALAGRNAPTELREVARAISDVGRWWP